MIRSQSSLSLSMRTSMRFIYTRKILKKILMFLNILIIIISLTQSSSFLMIWFRTQTLLFRKVWCHFTIFFYMNIITRSLLFSLSFWLKYLHSQNVESFIIKDCNLFISRNFRDDVDESNFATKFATKFVRNVL